MSNEIQVFENKYMPVMAQLSALNKQLKQLQEQEKALKADLEKAMNKYDIKSIDNEFVKITRVAESKTTTIDLKKLQEKEPVLYGELLEDYPKVTVRKASIRISVK